MLEVGQRGFACTHINIYLLMFNANTTNSSELDNISTSKKKCDFELNWLFLFSLNIFYLPIKQTKWIRHKLNKRMKSSPNYNMLQ